MFSGFFQLLGQVFIVGSDTKNCFSPRLCSEIREKCKTVHPTLPAAMR